MSCDPRCQSPCDQLTGNVRVLCASCPLSFECGPHSFDVRFGKAFEGPLKPRRKLLKEGAIKPQQNDGAPRAKGPLGEVVRPAVAHAMLSAHLVSACEGLGTAGDACPIVLACQRTPWPSGAGCNVEMLQGFGYNPSAIPAPPSVRAAGKRAGLEVAYLGTTRKWRWSPYCANDYTRRGDNGPGGASGRPTRSPITATDVLLLDAQMRILSRVCAVPRLERDHAVGALHVRSAPRACEWRSRS